jgi:hypothetical protein
VFVAEQPGRIRIVERGHLLAAPFLDIRGKIASGGERGLLSVAFHPDFEQNGLFYVNYTRAGDGATVVARYSRDPDASTADPASEHVLFTIPQPFANHNGGLNAFGPDGFLYVGMGDGGSGGDPMNNAQDDASRLGKLLRVDPCDRNPDDLREGATQPVALQLRSRHGRPLHRRRRPGPMGGGRRSARAPRGRRELGLAHHGGPSLLRAGDRLRRERPHAARPRVLSPAGRPRMRLASEGLLDHGRVRVPRLPHTRPPRPLFLRRLLLRVRPAASRASPAGTRRTSATTRRS